MDYSKLTDTELKQLKKNNRKLVLIGSIFLFIGCIFIFVFNTNINFSACVFLICSCLSIGCTIYGCVKGYPIYAELGKRRRQELFSQIHSVVPINCKTIVNVLSSNVGIKKGNYYIWRENNTLKFHPTTKVLDNPSEGIHSLFIKDILYYEVIGERYHETKITGGGKNRVSVSGAVVGNAIGGTAGAILLGNKGSKPIRSNDILHDTRKVRLNMVSRQEVICSFQDYNILKIVVPEKDSVNLSSKSSQQLNTEISSADEIAKFKKLLDDGIITADEFEQKKQQLLGL